jgi:hypothetical protein
MPTRLSRKSWKSRIRVSARATTVNALACTACQSQPNPIAPADATTSAEPASNQPPCTSYTVPVTVGGQQEQAVVESCQQPDGSWRITQNTPGLPPQVYVVPAPTQYPPEAITCARPRRAETARSTVPTVHSTLIPIYYYTYLSSYPYWAAEPWFFGLGPTIECRHCRQYDEDYGGSQQPVLTKSYGCTISRTLECKFAVGQHWSGWLWALAGRSPA